MTDYSPEEALRDAQATREKTAARIPTVWWYWPLQGLGIGLLVTGIALPHSPFTFVLYGLGVALALGATLFYRHRHGLWPRYGSGSSAMRIAWITYVAAAAAMVASALWLHHTRQSAPACWALGAMAAAALSGSGFAFDAQARKDARGGAR